MLTADLALARRRGDRIEPRLLDPAAPDLQERAGDLIGLFQAHQGRTRQELDEAVDDAIGADPQYRVLRGWTKLLLDRSEFATASPIEPERVREAVFRGACTAHPVLTGAVREQVLATAAQELDCSVAVVEAALYADLPRHQQMSSFEELSARDLLDRYNLAQAQALLYRCQEMHVWLLPQEAAGYRRVFAAVKQCRLIHTIQGSSERGYKVLLNGPVSLFHRSQRYGIQMALFLSDLLTCTGWRMRAVIADKEELVSYELDSRQQRLVPWREGRGPDGRPEAERVVAEWPRLDSRWSVTPSQEVVDCAGSAWVPDLVARAEGQVPVRIELLGYWTPRLLEERVSELRRCGEGPSMLVVSEELRCSKEGPTTWPAEAVAVKAGIDLRRVLGGLEALLAATPTS